MFDAIAPRYDLLNSLLSLSLHHGWRREAARQTGLKAGGCALDVCTGTGDLAVELARLAGERGRVWATDFSLPMLQHGEDKLAARTGGVAKMALADTLALPFAADTFDAVSVGFGIRNVADVEAGIQEMARVARPGGRVVLLEFNRPLNPFIARLYDFYSFRVMPFVGGLVSGRREAYEYLPSSVKAFHSREELTAMMERAGLEDVRVTDLILGTVVIHQG
jgi:demethylmenaquinone methyltransferase/2-methoxy-6-polyprenyl-1,4-benzoquinol methylase